MSDIYAIRAQAITYALELFGLDTSCGVINPYDWHGITVIGFTLQRVNDGPENVLWTTDLDITHVYEIVREFSKSKAEREANMIAFEAHFKSKLAGR